jgi:DNA mismatch repair protein MutL
MSIGNKIRILSDQTINQIAAGEVIENPACVVKELVENAIDAQATHISIEILSGGFQWIKISDNGSGMAPDDAALCLQRHATSKIFEAHDLFALTTMGFRGEALASIAAISKMKLLTALENSPAILLEVEGGKIHDIAPGARSRGTTVEVRSLFYNVPARKKFQKSVAASHAEITKGVTQLALAHPEVGFELIQKNHSQFSLPATPGEAFLIVLKRRASVLLGEEFLHSSHPLEMHEGNYQANGLIADPLHSRHNRSGQYLFVNRRPVFCPGISYAVRDAYGVRLAPDRHPIYLLHLSIPSELLDVNVHPQKKEIRLREESRVKHLLHSAVNTALLTHQSLTAESAISSSLPAIEKPFSFTADQRPDFSVPLFLKEEAAEICHREIAFDAEMRVIGLYRNYLLIEADSLPPPFSLHFSAVAWLDLRAVESRLQFDAMMRNSGTAALSQGLLIPLTVSYSRAEAQLLREYLGMIQKFGLQIREVGQTVFLIEAIPSFLQEWEVGIVLEEIIGQLQGIEPGMPLDEDKHRRLATCICKRVRSRKKSYHLTEATHLIKQLLQAEDPFHCPQGRKTLFYVREEEIESYFTRKAVLPHTVEALTERLEKGKT